MAPRLSCHWQRFSTIQIDRAPRQPWPPPRRSRLAVTVAGASLRCRASLDGELGGPAICGGGLAPAPGAPSLPLHARWDPRGLAQPLSIGAAAAGSAWARPRRTLERWRCIAQNGTPPRARAPPADDAGATPRPPAPRSRQPASQPSARRASEVGACSSSPRRARAPLPFHSLPRAAGAVAAIQQPSLDSAALIRNSPPGCRCRCRPAHGSRADAPRAAGIAAAPRAPPPPQARVEARLQRPVAPQQGGWVLRTAVYAERWVFGVMPAVCAQQRQRADMRSR